MWIISSGEFLTTFAFNQEQAANLSVTFQSYDKVFDEFAEVEEDDVIPDKTKLKVVVMPMLGHTPATPASIAVSTDRDRWDQFAVRHLECYEFSIFYPTLTYP